MIDTCISLLTTDNKEKIYQTYITDMLLGILQSQFTVRINVSRYADILNPPKETQRSADEIINDISHKLDILGK